MKLTLNLDTLPKVNAVANAIESLLAHGDLTPEEAARARQTMQDARLELQRGSGVGPSPVVEAR